MLAWLLGASVAAGASERAERFEWLVSQAVAWGSSQVVPPSGAAEGPGYVLALLEQGADPQAVQSALRETLAAQDTEDGSPTRGQFAWEAGEARAPGLRATYFASPLLAQICLKHSDKLPTDLREELDASLALALSAVRGNAPPSEDQVTALLRAAALAMLGRAVGQGVLVQDSVAHVGRWLADVLAQGLGVGHSPGADSYRLAALKWIWQAADAEQRSSELNAALALMYHDLAGRVQAGSGALAGAALFAQRGDYVCGGEHSPYLVYCDLAGPRPDQIRPSALFYVGADYVPPPGLLALAVGLLPYELSTEASAEAYVPRTDTYMHELFSLGTMTGQPSSTSIPRMLTFAAPSPRPTAYFFTTPLASHVTSIQHENVGLMTVDFDFVGQGSRRTATLSGILGPRSQVSEVRLGTGPWNGLPAAVPEMGTVALERSGCYIAVRVLRTGPVEGEQVVSGPKPATLAWTAEGDSGELQLTAYARKRSYDLRRPQHNFRAGVVVKVVPADSFESLSAFAADFRRARLRQSVERTQELLEEPPDDPFKAILTEHKPKSKSELNYKHMLLHTIKYESGELTMEVQEDMLSGEVVYRLVNGEPLAAPGPWQVGDQTIQWGAEALGSYWNF